MASSAVAIATTISSSTGSTGALVSGGEEGRDLVLLEVDAHSQVRVRIPPPRPFGGARGGGEEVGSLKEVLVEAGDGSMMNGLQMQHPFHPGDMTATQPLRIIPARSRFLAPPPPPLRRKMEQKRSELV